MLKWLVEVNQVCRSMREKALDALEVLSGDDKKQVAKIKSYIADDAKRLAQIWPKKLQRADNLDRHIHFSMDQDYRDLLKSDIPSIEKQAEQYAVTTSRDPAALSFESLLHPAVTKVASKLYAAGDFRNAVLDSIIAVFDLIRKRTGLDLDGEELINETFSLGRARLILTDLDTENGKNDQKGFIQIFKGVYQGIRNTKAHTLDHNLDATAAAQYLILASALARRVSEAKHVGRAEAPTGKPRVGQSASKK